MADQTYKACEVYAPGQIRLVKKSVPELGPTQVRLRVLACGINHADLQRFQGHCATDLPRVPGSEVIGDIEAIGAEVSGWRVGMRVGCSHFGGQCGFCPPCRKGDLIHCEHLIVTGQTVDGGWAEVMSVESRALVRVSDALPPKLLAHMFGAGVSVFKALTSGVVHAGDVVAIVGIGGLGHLAVQFASRMGYQTVAVSRGTTKRLDCLRFGAHAFVDTSEQDLTRVLRSIGGAQAILSSQPGAASEVLLDGLAARGTLFALNTLGNFHQKKLCSLSLSVRGIAAGTPFEVEEAIRFAVANRVTPAIEVVTIDRISDALTRLEAGNTRFRSVLVF